MGQGSRRRLAALLLAVLAAVSSRAVADDGPSSDPFTQGEGAWMAGDYDGARAFFESALRNAEAEHGPRDFSVAEALDRLGTVVLEQGDCRESALYGRRALAILDEAGPGSDPTARAHALGRLAGALSACGDLRGAERERRRALDAWIAARAESSRGGAVCLADLAEDCRKLGRTADARGYLLRARRILEGLDTPDDPRIATVVLGLGAVAEDEGDLDRARAFYREAVASRRRVLGADHPFLAEALAAYARALIRTGNMGDAVDASLEAESIRRAHLRYTVRSLPERQALAYEARLVSGLGVAVAAGVRTWDSTLVERVWDSVVRSRAVVLDEMASRHRWSGAEADTTSDELIATWAGARQRLAHLAVRGPLEERPDVHRAALDSLRAASERAEHALLARSALRAESRRTDAGFRDVVATLPDGAALVSLVRYEDPLASGASRPDSARAPSERGTASYAAFVTRGRGSPAWAIPLGSADELDSLVTLWRDQVSRPAKGDEALGAAERRYSGRLRARLWDPIQARLRGVTRVVLVPDGSLHLVNPNALRLEDGRFFVEDGPVVQIVSSERDLIGPPSAGPPGAGFLGIADPDFDALPSDSGSVLDIGTAPDPRDEREVRRGAPCAGGDGRPQWERLPGSAREVEEAAALWQRTLGGARDGGGVEAGTHDGSGARDPESSGLPHPPASPQARLVLGRAASESAFRRLAGGRRIVHVATHGFFADACPGWAETRARDPASFENPLSGAGLVLAGANLPIPKDTPLRDDGILTADEIAGVDLSGVEMVVLSGCETGVGVVRAGEGVLGIRRAFEIAGARTLILSLWPVTDRAARAWTTRFYQARLIGGLDAAAAAREASRGVLEARRAAGESLDPIFWAAFIAAGR